MGRPQRPVPGVEPLDHFECLERPNGISSAVVAHRSEGKVCPPLVGVLLDRTLSLAHCPIVLALGGEDSRRRGPGHGVSVVELESILDVSVCNL